MARGAPIYAYTLQQKYAYTIVNMSRKEASRAIGERLRRHFAEMGIGQAEVAKRYGVSQSWISRIFDGDFSLRSAVARRMCEDAEIAFSATPPAAMASSMAQRLKLELMEAWDGTEGEARQISQILRALAALKLEARKLRIKSRSVSRQRR